MVDITINMIIMKYIKGVINIMVHIRIGINTKEILRVISTKIDIKRGINTKRYIVKNKYYGVVISMVGL